MTGSPRPPRKFSVRTPHPPTGGIAPPGRDNGHLNPREGTGGEPNPRLEAALAYAARGWGVVALHTPIVAGRMHICSCADGALCQHTGRHPRYDSKLLPHGAKNATTDPAVIRSWWEKWPDANVGIATGRKWGLLVLDIDPRNGGDDTLAALEADLGKLPDTVEAISGGGGSHRLFIHPGCDVRGDLGPGIDVLSDGRLFVAEPSVHESGNHYNWELSSTPDTTALAELPERWRSEVCQESRGGDNRVIRDVREFREDGSPPTPVNPVDPAVPANPVDPANPADPVVPTSPLPGWDEARLFAETLPRGPGQHDRCTINFARGVRLNLRIADERLLVKVFDRWYERAKPKISNQDWDDCYHKFRRAFRIARVPLGAHGFASQAYELAHSEPLPRIALTARGDRKRLLIAMCCQMHRLVGSPFKLSTHQIGALFRVEPSTAWYWLRDLEDGLVIRCEYKGRPGRPGAHAASFTYLGD